MAGDGESVCSWESRREPQALGGGGVVVDSAGHSGSSSACRIKSVSLTQCLGLTARTLHCPPPPHFPPARLCSHFPQHLSSPKPPL